MPTMPEETFASRLRALTRPEAFPFAVPAGEPAQVIQTHASAVLLAGERAYKLKKPEDFGFFDYSTPARRRHFCSEEVRLNARLAPDVYLGVAPVLAATDGTPSFGPTLPPDDLPPPGAWLETELETGLETGRVVDYAVVMRRLPEEATLQARVASGNASAAMLQDVARHVAAFHAADGTNERIAHFGSLDVVTANWDENFEQMRPYIGRAMDEATFDRIEDYVRRFLAQRATLLQHRIEMGRIRDCHGDLRLQHVYLLDDATRGGSAANSSRTAIVDCIEFNERFRYSDIAAELAFLTMELDLAGRPDLARAFVTSYVAASGDEELRELLPFYACYRACVRGKVLAFQLDQAEAPPEQRAQVQAEARAHFELAAFYAQTQTQPTLLLLGGLMGSGKSTLATLLHDELGWSVVSSDATRKRLAQRDLSQHDTSAFGEGLYSPEWTARTYAALLADAEHALAQGRSVILDASFSRRGDRHAAAKLGVARGARVVFAECVCPESLAMDRLRRRWTDDLSGTRAAERTSVASDGRPELYAAQRAAWEPFDAVAEPQLTQVLIATDRSLPASAHSILDALGLPHLACFLRPAGAEA